MLSDLPQSYAGLFGVTLCVASASLPWVRCFGCRRPLKAELVVNISKSQQRLAVMVDGAEAYRWPISSGRRGFETPTGSYRPTRLERHWYSRQYNRTPMPWAMFFHRGYAVHGTMEAYNLGHAVSHGCVRLRPDKAAILFSLMRRHGAKQHQGRGDERPAAGRAAPRPPMADNDAADVVPLNSISPRP